ncbi:hypothetical protein N7527_003966 [Penicillium freii]|nr:hypothetical protein N7527_003966 [Penicillium freii]
MDKSRFALKLDMNFALSSCTLFHTSLQDERPIPTIRDVDLNQLTQLRVRGIRRAEQHERIVDQASRLLDEAQVILVDFSDPYQSPASDLLWDIEGRMEVLVDPLLGLWAEETQDHELEERIWAQLP